MGPSTATGVQGDGGMQGRCARGVDVNLGF